MIYLKTFDQINESKDSNVLETLLEKFSKGINNDKLLKLLEPYKDTLKKYYDKYYKNGVIDSQLIYNDFKSFNFSANERYSWEDYGDDKSKNPILRFLYKVFVRFPKSFAKDVWEMFEYTVLDEFRERSFLGGIVGSLLWIMVAILVYILGFYAYKATDWYFNGLNSGKVITELHFIPEHEEAILNTMSDGKTTYTYTTYIHIPDTWTTKVEGDNGRIEDWQTTNRNLVNKIKVGMLINNDDNWDWYGTEKR
jgi:hypothetical protein